MKAFHLAFSLVRVPRLFVTLLLWPLCIGLLVAALQIGASSSYLYVLDETMEEYEKRVQEEYPDEQFVREFIFGRERPFDSLTVCRWRTEGAVEVAPNPECSLDSLDVTLIVDSPGTYDPKDYVDFFRGATPRIHLCRTCGSDIRIRPEVGDKPITNIHSFQGYGVFFLARSAQGRDLRKHYVQVKGKVEDLKDLQGELFLHPEGFAHPVPLTGSQKTIVLMINTGILLVVTLWLALRAHRKVLDYFSRNDALLPLVAACGKNTFYRGIWIITMARVACFLLASLPATCYIYAHSLRDDTISRFVTNWTDFALWLICIAVSLGSLTVIASVAELKHRHSWVSFLYKYVPLGVCIIGSLVWGLTIFYQGEVFNALQQIISALPVIGISPVVLAPLFKVNPNILAIHAVLASLLISLALRRNARWFAAHLEEL